MPRLFALIVPALILLIGPARAAEPLRVGTAAESLMFVPLDVGLSTGIFARLGLDVQKLALSGAAKLNQALTAEAVDVGLTGSTDFSYQVKGEPTKTVAGIIVSAADFGITVGNDIHSVADLKGRRIGVSQNGTLTYWMAREFARSQGWGPDGISTVAVGGENAQHMAALLSGGVAAVMWHIEVGMTLEEQHRGRVLVNADSFIPGFLTNTVSATDQVIARRPEALRRFLRGWFASVDYMMAHEDEAVADAVKATGLEAKLLRQALRGEKDTWSRTGRISTPQLQEIARTITEIGLVPRLPELAPFYDPRFLPPAPLADEAGAR